MNSRPTNQLKMPPERSPEIPRDNLTTSEHDELITLRVQVKDLRELSGFRAEQLKESELRFQQMMQQFELVTRAPAPPPRHSSPRRQRRPAGPGGPGDEGPEGNKVQPVLLPAVPGAAAL